MSQKHQKQSIKGRSKRNSATKQSKKNDKKSVMKLSVQQLQQIQSDKIKQFFSLQLLKINHKINISPVDQCITQNIINGSIILPDQSKNVSMLIKSPQQQTKVKITTEQMQMYEKQARRVQHLKLLANLNKQLVNKQPQQNISYILTKQQHQRKVRDIIQQKRRRQKRAEQIKQLIRIKLQKQQKQLQQRIKQQKIEQKEKKRIQIQQKITKQKQDHIHFLSSDIKHRKDFQQLINKVPLHIKMQQKYKQSIQIPQLQQKKKLYKQLRDFKHRYSVDNIKEYTKQHDQKYNYKLQQSKLKRSKLTSLTTIQQKLKSANKNYQKSQRLKTILAEQIHNLKKQWSSKQLYAQQKIKREQNYVKKLKQQYRPKIDKNKKQQIQARLIKSKSHLSKVGLDLDKRKFGLQYLNQIKKLAQKRKQFINTHRLNNINPNIQNTNRQNDIQHNSQINLRHQYKSQTLLPIMKRSMSQQNVFDMNKNRQLVQKMRQKKLSNIINSQQQPNTKLSMLQIQTQKIQQSKKHKLDFLKHNFNSIASKQASNLALNSIKAKINLIQLMKNK